MKKISLKNLGTDEILTRDELKKVMGGTSGSGDSGVPDCMANDDCPGGCEMGGYCSTCCIA